MLDQGTPVSNAAWTAVINGTLLASTLIIVVELLFAGTSPRLSAKKGAWVIMPLGFALFLAVGMIFSQANGEVVVATVDGKQVEGLKIHMLGGFTGFMQVIVFLTSLLAAIFANFHVQNEHAK